MSPFCVFNAFGVLWAAAGVLCADSKDLRFAARPSRSTKGLRVHLASIAHACVSTLFGWLEERMEAQSLADDALSKYVPPHVGLFFCLGGFVVMAFVAQFTTGLLLTFYFAPTVVDACASVALLELCFGWARFS